MNETEPPHLLHSAIFGWIFKIYVCLEMLTFYINQIVTGMNMLVCKTKFQLMTYSQ